MENKSINIKEEILKSYDEKFLPMQDRVPYYVEYETAKDFLSNSLDRMREETAKEIFGTMDSWQLYRLEAENLERYAEFRDKYLEEKPKA